MTDKAPERIWQYRTDPLNEMYCGVEYVRADIHQALEAERDKLRHAMMKACDLIDDVAEGKTGMGTPYRVLAGALQETEK